MAPVLDYAPPQRKPFPWKWAVPTAFIGWWGSVLLGPLFLILLPAAFAATVTLAICRRWRWLAASALLSPMVLSAAAGTVEFAIGRATIQGMGLMRHPVNVDPDTRLQYSSGGCLVTGNEFLTQEPHNLAVMACRYCFGIMPGAYAGPYPSEADAYAALSGASPLDLNELRTDRVTVAGATTTLRKALGARLLDGFWQGPATDPADPQLVAQYGPPQVTVYAGTCLILAIPCSPLDPTAENRIVFLIDAKTGKCFAQYRNHTGSAGYHARWDTGWN